MSEKKETSPYYFYGLPNSAAKAYFVCRNYLKKHPKILFVSDKNPEDFAQAAQEFAPQHTFILSFPEYEAGRLAALYRLLHAPEGESVLLCVPDSALCAPLPAPQDFLNGTFTVKHGDRLRRQELLDKLETAGYTREEYAETAGQYAARGSVVDVFSPLQDEPLRLYFAGNRVDLISVFDLDTQNTKRHADEAVIIPLSFKNTPAVLTDFLTDYAFIFDEPEKDFSPDAYPAVAIIRALPCANAQDGGLKSNLPFNANLGLVDREVANLQKQGFAVNITCLNRGELDRMTELSADYPHFKTARFSISPLTEGFYSPQDKTAFITTNEILNRRFNAAKVVKNFDVEGAKRVRFKELQAGDYVVHQEHGVGRYLGLQVLDPDDNPTDCLIIEYRRGSRLYVPMYDFKKVQKYIGAGGKKPALSVLGGITWKEVKKRVKEEAQKTAKEILKLEALRQATPAPEVTGDARIEEEFADSFPYTLTAGQEQAIRDTLHDLDLPKPMDRVLVGDVGFGKTEVAMRAALRVVLSGKQVMLVVPTTILAAQHYKTFSKRLAGFPVNVRMLCRFQTAKEQKTVVQELKSGVCDVIIGTHRLMSKDIVFKDLGLVIIDEEHRFGVRQKEKIRAKSTGVHSLMLSATPIPRTLNQSLSSLRDISLIDTPPRGRTPIKTVVTAWNDELAAAAITQELARGGQVYYVYNSVQSMESRLLLLKKLVPQARICMAHGQMDEKALEQTLWDFNAGKYDVLLASTIIESGIDITNANTLIVENAHNFGLAQLYQLRGRIGRGDQKAFCYLFHPDWLFKKTEQTEDNFSDLAAVYWKPKEEKDPTEEAKQRLAALMEFGDLGSGFRLALRDMEIRGAGELLGVKQHGYVNEVGLSLYCDLVSAEVKKLRGERPEPNRRATVSLPLAAYIPPDYLPDEAERLKYYKMLMDADETKTKEILAKLADLCGPVPTEILNLTRLFALSARAGKLEIYHLDRIEGKLELLFTRRFQMPPQMPAELFNRFGAENLEFIKSKNGDGLHLTLPAGKDPVAFAEEALTFFERLTAPEK
ncbi:MAG: DEAD/DEAH box helicase [Candidatus Avelusimicrobium sp.]|uniref:DEAD/DEAH box helicase n=1 Tax=Candidatus Avelusimicrobium sp. TaxID=3048833 RepID=UPI003F0D5A68